MFSNRYKIALTEKIFLDKQRACLKLALCFFFPLLALFGCASAPQTALLLSQPESDFATPVLLANIPFFPQDAYQCGPAALATMLVSSGLTITPEQLVPLVYVPARKGSFQVELIAATRSFGRLAYEIPPTLDDLLSEINAGNPVLVLQNLGVSWYQKWHFAVVTGYDLQRHKIIMNSGTRENYEVSLRAFENTWERSKHWAMVVLEPGTMPVTAEPSRYFNAVVALEKNNEVSVASKAYDSGLQRWPTSRELLMGYGNLHYKQQDLLNAQMLFSSVITTYPDYAPAYNNLAQVEYELGNHALAQTRAQQAVALSGPRLATYQATLQTILESNL